MINAQTDQVMNAPIEKVFQVLSDFEKYPEFMDGVSSVEILEHSETSARVKYNLNIIKKFTYTIDLKITAPTEISWTFESGDLFKANNGKWKLTDKGDGTTHVDYSLDVDFKVMVPGMISKKLVKSNLPSLMKSVNERAQKL